MLTSFSLILVISYPTEEYHQRWHLVTGNERETLLFFFSRQMQRIFIWEELNNSAVSYSPFPLYITSVNPLLSCYGTLILMLICMVVVLILDSRGHC